MTDATGTATEVARPECDTPLARFIYCAEADRRVEEAWDEGFRKGYGAVIDHMNLSGQENELE